MNRPALTNLAGLNAGKPNEQILPPGIPGYRNANIYPLDRPNIQKAKALLGGRTEKVVMYTTNDRVGSATGQMVKANLAAIGLDVEVKEYTFAVLIDKAATRGSVRHVVDGSFADYPDPTTSSTSCSTDGRSAPRTTSTPRTSRLLTTGRHGRRLAGVAVPHTGR